MKINEDYLIECRRTSLLEGGVPKHPSNNYHNCLGNLSYPTAFYLR